MVVARGATGIRDAEVVLREYVACLGSCAKMRPGGSCVTSFVTDFVTDAELQCGTAMRIAVAPRGMFKTIGKCLVVELDQVLLDGSTIGAGWRMKVCPWLIGCGRRCRLDHAGRKHRRDCGDDKADLVGRR